MVEEAARKSPGSAELEAEAARAREDLAGVQRERDEAEAQARLAEAQQHRAFFVREQREDRQEKLTFRRYAIGSFLGQVNAFFVREQREDRQEKLTFRRYAIGSFLGQVN